MLNGGGAHVSFTDAIDGVPAKDRGEKVPGLPYSLWQLVEHIRIAQHDMLQFSKDANYQSPNWPDDYWPKDPAPAEEIDWDESVQAITNDLREFIERMNKSENILDRIPHGDGQTILQEALQIADHTAYHTAEIVVIRRLQGSWNV